MRNGIRVFDRAKYNVTLVNRFIVLVPKQTRQRRSRKE